MRRDRLSSSTHSRSRAHLLMKLSCEMSTSCCALTTTNARPSAANAAMTSSTTSLVGRRHRVWCGTQRDRGQLGERRRTTHLAILGVAIGQLLKDETGDIAMEIGRQLLIDLFGVAVEGMPKRLDRRLLVVGRSIGSPRSRAVARDFPHPHQRVLEHRQLILVLCRPASRARLVGAKTFRRSRTGAAGRDGADPRRRRPPPGIRWRLAAARASSAAPETGCRSALRATR